MRATALQLYPFQEQGVQFLTEQKHRFLADEMGLGKTPQAVRAMDKIDAKTAIVICPATIKINWARQINAWSLKKRTIFIVKTGQDIIPPHAGVIIINYELVISPKIYKQLKKRGEVQGYDVAIIDEARYLKSMDAKRTRRILGKGSFLQHANYKWALDGTPVPNRPIELFPILKTFAPEVIEPYTAYSEYGLYFCKGKKDFFGFNFKGASNIAELQQRLKPFMLRRLLKDVLPQMPGKVDSVIELDLIPTCDTSDTPPATVRKQLAVLKIPSACSFVRDKLTSVEKLVVFAHHRDVIEAVTHNMRDEGAVKLYGGMSVEDKQKSIDSFVHNPSTRIIVCQTVAGGTGVDGLQGVCNHVVFVELDWSPGVMDQAIDRLHRIGQKNTLFIYYLAVPNSMDTDMDRVLELKRNVINQLITGDDVKMTIEQTLLDILSELKTLNNITAHEAVTNRVNAVGSSANPPLLEKPKTTRAKKETVASPDPEVGSAAPATKSETTVSDEELRALAGRFVGAGETPEMKEKYRNVILTFIMPKYGAKQLSDLAPEHYQQFKEDLQLGPEAYLPAEPVKVDPLAI